MEPSRRWLLNQATHSSVASSTDAIVFQGALRWISSVLYKPLIVSASARSSSRIRTSKCVSSKRPLDVALRSPGNALGDGFPRQHGSGSQGSLRASLRTAARCVHPAAISNCRHRLHRTEVASGAHGALKRIVIGVTLHPCRRSRVLTVMERTVDPKLNYFLAESMSVTIQRHELLSTWGHARKRG